MAKALRERVEKQYTGTQRTRKAVHGECTVELAKWTFLVISLCREPYEVKVSRTGLTGGMGRRTVRQRALCLPSKTVYTGREEKKKPNGEVRQVSLCKGRKGTRDANSRHDPEHYPRPRQTEAPTEKGKNRSG